MKTYHQVSTYVVAVLLLSLFACGGDNVIDNSRPLISITSPNNTPVAITHLNRISVASTTFYHLETTNTHQYFGEVNDSVTGIDNPIIMNDALLTTNENATDVINNRLKHIMS